MSALVLDQIDMELLDCLQSDCRISQAELGFRMHLSESSVRRRLDILRKNGVIAREVAIVDPERVSGVRVLVNVCFERESPELYGRFRLRMLALEEVMQCYSVAGGVDFILMVYAPDLPSYERWGERELMSWPEIRRYDSHVVWSTVKFSTKLPLKLGAVNAHAAIQTRK
jgi:Lrp/AsnC family transcriptional regulator, leucine-responsive regulatory protein